MRTKIKCSNILKIIILTLFVGIALSFSKSWAMPSKMELDVRSNSIKGTNADNPGLYVPWTSINIL